MNTKSLSLKTRLILGFSCLILLLFISSGAGYKGMSDISDMLTFVSGPAWDTADGAMEGTIGVEAEMIVIHEVLQGASMASLQSRYQEAQAVANEALQRMADAQLIPEQRIQALDSTRQQFAIIRDQILQQTEQLRQQQHEIEQDFLNINQLITTLEKQIDQRMERQLSQNDWLDPIEQNRTMSINWALADGTMNAQIELLNAYTLYLALLENKNIALINDIQQAQQSFAEEISRAEQYQSYLHSTAQSVTQLKTAVLQLFDKINKNCEIRASLNQSSENYSAASEKLLSLIGEIEEEGDSKVENEASKVGGMISQSVTILLGTMLLSLLAAIFIGWSTLQAIARPINQALKAAQKIAKNDFSTQFTQQPENETGKLLNALHSMQTSLQKRIERDKSELRQNARILQALDNASVNVLILDSNQQVLYFNRSMFSLMQRKPQILTHKQDLDQFIGTSIDEFVANNSLTTEQLSALTEPQQLQAQFGIHQFTLTLIPIVDKSQQRIGTLIEWLDITDEKGMQAELDQILEQAIQGNLNQTIDTTNKSGFFLSLSQSLNQLLSLSSAIIDDTQRIFSGLSQGNLQQRITNDYQGQFLSLKTDANRSLEKLSQLMQSILEAVNNVNHEFNEYSQAASDLNNRTENQASMLQEVTSSMIQMKNNVHQSAINAREALENTRDTEQQAHSGEQIVQKTMTSMEEITHSSNKISDIITVIDEIAFQTNLLALNAAVEAARAGEQGRGFAVVASEVRQLAQRSASSAKEISKLIHDSSHKVESGRALVNQSGAVLKEIFSRVNRINHSMVDIDAAATEQASGIEQISQALSHMDQITQENAAMVEQSAAASENMLGQMDGIRQSLSHFKL